MKLNYNISLKEIQPEFVSLITAKAHLKIDFDYEDDLIKLIIEASIAVVEDCTGVFVSQRDVVIQSNVFFNSLKIEYGPILDSSFEVRYLDEGNSLVNISERFTLRTEYARDPEIVYQSTQSFPRLHLSHKAVEVSYVSGMTKENLPKPLYQAMLLLIAEMYEYRSDRASINNTRAQALMRPYKKFV